MSKTWYPVISREECIECGACVDKCKHGVYDKSKAPRPEVVKPEGCVQGCTGCGNLCPSSAITYFGNSNSEKATKGGCSCE